MSAVGIAAAMIRGGEASTVLVGGFDSMTRAPHALRHAPGAADGRRADDRRDGPRRPVLLDRRRRHGRDVRRRERAAGHLARGAGRARGALARQRRRRRATGSPRRSSPLPQTRRATRACARRASRRWRSCRPRSRRDGTITAGNASQVSDGAAAAVVTTADRATRPARRRVVGRAVVAGPDSTLHLRPAEASRKLLDAARAQRRRTSRCGRSTRRSRASCSPRRTRLGDRPRARQRQRRRGRARAPAGRLGPAAGPHARLRAAPPRRRIRRRHAVRRRRSGRSDPAPTLLDVLVIGAGPVRPRGRQGRARQGPRAPAILGRHMAFWREHMPAGHVPALRPGLAPRPRVRADPRALPRAARRDARPAADRRSSSTTPTGSPRRPGSTSRTSA